VKRKALVFSLLVAALIVGYGCGRAHYYNKSSRTNHILYYVDPMHPSYRSNRPGTAPDCGMELVAVSAEDAGNLALTSRGKAGVGLHIDLATQQLYGIKVSKVSKASGRPTIRAFGRVAIDETRVFKINLGTDGYVKETHADAVGNQVKKDQHLATIYSPDFLAVTGGYLSANERTPGNSPKEVTSVQNSASAQARADRLRNLGMSDVQIEEISTTRKIPEDVYVVSPTNGFIVSRNISPGLRFERNTDLYTIADLSHIWIMVNIFSTDSNALAAGTTVYVTLPGTNQNFKARVSNVLPEVDPASHTLKLRLEADNPGFKLRPDMFVNVELPMVVSTGLSVPADAILDSGSSKRVFVQTAEGNFVPREVQTGWQINNDVQIVRGLSEGELVASEGTFLIDSESRTQSVPISSGDTSAALRNETASNIPRRELQK
jgi:Cu(I)/Ag(I) efflux system membrane fusion protein